MTVLHTVDSCAPEAGGPSRSVPALVDALCATGVDARLHVTAEEEALADLEGAEIVHDHGLWLPSNHRAARMARREGVPLVVSSRGMLEPWALAHRRWKKRAAWALYQRADLAGAAAIHATSEAEAEAVRAAGVRAPVAIVPNGVRVPDTLPPRQRGTAHRALFLSRVHPIKGLPFLVEAWGRVQPADWELVVAGPDEGGHRAEVERLVDRAGLGEAVRFVGPVSDDDKWALYRTADLFVLPTHSENFGIVVAEALAAGVPVLTTTGAPWASLRAEHCGWWTPPTADGIADALCDATSRDRADLEAMGLRGRAHVQTAFSWPTIGERMADVYRWVLHGGRVPDYVHVG